MPAMYVALPRRIRDMPEVRRIARRLEVDPLLVVGALHEVWAYCQDMDTTRLPGESHLIEEDMRLPEGLFHAMEEVGWAGVSPAALEVLWMPELKRGPGRPVKSQNNSEGIVLDSENAAIEREKERARERTSDSERERTRERETAKPKAASRSADAASRSPSVRLAREMS